MTKASAHLEAEAGTGPPVPGVGMAREALPATRSQDRALAQFSETPPRGLPGHSGFQGGDNFFTMTRCPEWLWMPGPFLG